MKKLKMAALALSIGVGLSGVVSTSAMARPDASSCDNLASKCAAGDSNACRSYQLFCGVCEVFPSACG